ncbi:MAG UNVERIFIED_CONTAM: hypothetical protein LVR18_17095 [Planctomycetaceae bacterium]|jgi:hypothetical protein
MTNSSDLHFLVILLLVVLFMDAVAGIPTLIAVGVGVFSFLRRSARERVEGTNTPAAQGSRVGMKLGACAALLFSLLWLPEFIGSGQPGFPLPGVLAICIVPSVAYGMLSGSLAGQCATRIGAVMVGATMFLLMQDPIGLCLLFNRLLANAGGSHQRTSDNRVSGDCCSLTAVLWRNRRRSLPSPRTSARRKTCSSQSARHSKQTRSSRPDEPFSGSSVEQPRMMQQGGQGARGQGAMHISHKTRLTNSCTPEHGPIGEQHWIGETKEKHHENIQSSLTIKPVAHNARCFGFRP